MEDHVKRMLEEHKQLEDKINKLTGFLFENIFNELDNERKRLLIEQYAFMKAYAKTLKNRIDIELNK